MAENGAGQRAAGGQPPADDGSTRTRVYTQLWFWVVVAILAAAGASMAIGQQIALAALMVITSKGAAGITGAGLVTLTASLQAFGGTFFSPESIAVGITARGGCVLPADGGRPAYSDILTAGEAVLLSSSLRRATRSLSILRLRGRVKSGNVDGLRGKLARRPGCLDVRARRTGEPAHLRMPPEAAAQAVPGRRVLRHQVAGRALARPDHRSASQGQAQARTAMSARAPGG